MNKNCLHCNTPIEGGRLTKKYCNDNCKQAAYFQRSKTTDNKDAGSNLTATDVTKQSSVTSETSQPTIQGIILEDIHSKINQLLSFQAQPGLVIHPQDHNSPYKSIIILVPK